MNEVMIARELLSIAKRMTGGGWDRFSEDLVDVIEGQVVSHKGRTSDEIFRIIKGDSGIVSMMSEEGMTDRELKKCISDSMAMYRGTMYR